MLCFLCLFYLSIYITFSVKQIRPCHCIEEKCRQIEIVCSASFFLVLFYVSSSMFNFAFVLYFYVLFAFDFFSWSFLVCAALLTLLYAIHHKRILSPLSSFLLSPFVSICPYFLSAFVLSFLTSVFHSEI